MSKFFYSTRNGRQYTESFGAGLFRVFCIGTAGMLQAVVFSLFFTHFVQAKSFATLDWTVAETLIALGEKPLAVGEADSYSQWVGQPELPVETIDLGIRMQPNPEQMLTLAKAGETHFINSGFYASVTPMLAKFATVVDTVDFYAEGDAWHNIERASRKVAEIIGKPQAFEAMLTRFRQKTEEIRPLVKPFTDRPIVLVQFIDTRHLRIYAENSLFGAVLARLGFKNAWDGAQNIWGFETIEVTRLAKLPPNSRFVVVKPYPHNIGSALKYNVLWQKLAMAKDPLILPAVWTFGGIPSAQRFAEVLAAGLLHGGETW